MFKTAFSHKNVNDPKTDFSLTLADKPQNSLVLYLQV